MIYILYAGSRVLAEDNGTVVNPEIYWGSDIMAGIQAAFEAGEWESIPDPVILPPEPLWDQFLANFFLPGNILYNATATKVQASSPFVIEHWTNMKLGLQNSTIRSEPWLQLSYAYLKQILANEGNAITPEIEQAWVDMASLYNINLIPT
jgi:hypothetical protein